MLDYGVHLACYDNLVCSQICTKQRKAVNLNSSKNIINYKQYKNIIKAYTSGKFKPHQILQI